jgi:hypothetical protein
MIAGRWVGKRDDTPHEPWTGLAEERQPRGRSHKSPTLLCEDQAGDGLPMSCDAEWTVQASRRAEYRSNVSSWPSQSTGGTPNERKQNVSPIGSSGRISDSC